MSVARGPSLYRIRGRAGELEAQLAAGTIAAPTVGAAVVFEWPRALVVESVLAHCTSGVDVDDAGLELAILDQHLEAVVSDSLQAEFVSARALAGPRRRWFQLSVPVAGRDKWTIQLQNVGPNAITPRLFFRVRDAS